MRVLQETNLPYKIAVLLKALSSVGFFDRSVLVGSWVMPIYHDLYQVQYVLKTMDVDLAVYIPHQQKAQRSNLEQIITDMGCISFLSTGGVQKFSTGGYTVEFITHRVGGRDADAKLVKEWNIIAQPLPYISILIDFTDEASLGDCPIRFPVPEAFFIHKLIIAPRRRGIAKRMKDLEQCSILMESVKDDVLLNIMQSIRLSKETKRFIRNSCYEIGFPLQRLGLS